MRETAGLWVQGIYHKRRPRLEPRSMMAVSTTFRRYWTTQKQHTFNPCERFRKLILMKLMTKRSPFVFHGGENEHEHRNTVGIKNTETETERGEVTRRTIHRNRFASIEEQFHETRPAALRSRYELVLPRVSHLSLASPPFFSRFLVFSPESRFPSPIRFSTKDAAAHSGSRKLEGSDNVGNFASSYCAAKEERRMSLQTPPYFLR